MTISKPFSGMIIFSLLSLGYFGIKSASNGGSDLSTVELVLTSAVVCGDNPDVLGCTIYLRNNKDRPIYLSDLHGNSVLIIEGKEHPAKAYWQLPKRLFPEMDFYELIYFRVGRETLRN